MVCSQFILQELIYLHGSLNKFHKFHLILLHILRHLRLLVQLFLEFNFQADLQLDGHQVKHLM